MRGFGDLFGKYKSFYEIDVFNINCSRKQLLKVQKQRKVDSWPRTFTSYLASIGKGTILNGVIATPLSLNRIMRTVLS